jgi:NAD(P)-dependent dehydrogenase (short-subunit alcohol dehydrogenase family)
MQPNGNHSRRGLAEHPRLASPYRAWQAPAGPTPPQLEIGHSGDRGAGRLAGRKALITGGECAVGHAAALAFAREGADVAFSYAPSQRSGAEQLARLIRETGRKAVALPGDLHDEAFCNRLVAHAAHELGGLDVLVSNAPRQYAIADIADMSTDQFDATFRTNIYAMFWLTKAALLHMGHGASIINTSSIDAYDPAEILLDYSATKGAIMVFTKSLAKQLASRGIRVNAVAPGPIWTPLRSSDDPSSEPALAEDESEIGGASQPIGARRPAEIASICVLLASNESSYATGQLYGAVG